MMDKIRTVSCRYAYIVLAGAVCSAMVAFFVTGIVGGGNVSHAAAAICNVKSFGAVGDGTHKDTTAIQNAINSCASAGGGTVEVPPGTYLSAPLFLKSNITLRLIQGPRSMLRKRSAIIPFPQASL